MALWPMLRRVARTSPARWEWVSEERCSASWSAASMPETAFARAVPMLSIAPAITLRVGEPVAYP